MPLVAVMQQLRHFKIRKSIKVIHYNETPENLRIGFSVSSRHRLRAVIASTKGRTVDA